MCCDVTVPQASSDSQMKKLEEQLSEANRRGDDLQRTLTEISVAKNRLTGKTMLHLWDMSNYRKSFRNPIVPSCQWLWLRR